MKSNLLAAAATAAALGLMPTIALAADDAPDLTGKWTGTTFTIVAGTGGHWPESAGTFAKPALFEKAITVTITGQVGRRFWGTTSIADDQEPNGEPLIGEITPDGKRLVIADTDGYWDGTIDGDTFSFCYAQAGGPTHSSVVSCTSVKHQH
jgi:hypothetical protein